MSRRKVHVFREAYLPDLRSPAQPTQLRMLSKLEAWLKCYGKIAAIALPAAGVLIGWVHEDQQDRSHAVREQAVRLQADAFERRRTAADSILTSLGLLERDVLRLNDTLRTLSLGRRLGYDPRTWDRTLLLPLVTSMDTTNRVVDASFVRYARRLDPESRKAAYARRWWLRTIASDLRFDNVAGVYHEKQRTEQLDLLDLPTFQVRTEDSVVFMVP